MLDLSMKQVVEKSIGVCMKDVAMSQDGMMH